MTVVREIEKLGDRIHGRRRAAVLTRVRASIGADSLMLLDLDDDEIAVAALAGAVVEESTIRRLTSHDPGRRKGVVIAERKADRTIALVARRGSHTLLATFVGNAPSSWQRDLFGFVAEKLLRNPSARSAADENETPGENALILPPGFVTGESASMRALLAQVRSAANARIDVLVTGETGSGKELVARALHESGWGRKAAFVAINCAAIPGDLLESELFGVHGRVATGVDPRQGLVLRANGGTLFLDEIAELPERLQAKLLRVLQEREVLPLGAARPTPIDLRVIAASNRDLKNLIHEGQFRADLYYRLRGLELFVPPLRERREDIPGLAQEFLDRAVLEVNKRITGITPKALDLLLAHDWHGNVRELASDIRCAVLIAPDGAPLRASHFAARHAIAEEPPLRSLQDAIDATERGEIERALAATGGNRTRAASLLGITRNGLALKLRRHGLRGDKPLR
jgi:DNA-binding NtrC family response regulator